MNPIINKSHIEYLCKDHGTNTSKDAVIASVLRSDITSGFNQGSFISELLQNADDKAENSSEITFSLDKEELIVYHHGKPFEKEDVDRISTYSDVRNNLKSQDCDKAGYKDKGFKSVFKIAYRVDIWSKDWHFHFDESSEKWKRDGKLDPDYPWQIAPIWTEYDALSENAKKIVGAEGRTSFIFKLREDCDVTKELEDFKESPEKILFLKKIRKVHLFINGASHTLSQIKNQVFKDDCLHSEWEKSDHVIKIDEKIQEFLSKCKPEECPKWLTEGKPIILTLAYPISNFQPEINLYATLPTAERMGLPFVVNAPFLLNPSRGSLVQNQWNIFLIQKIAKINFEQVKENLSKKQYKFLKFLALPHVKIHEQKLSEEFAKEMMVQLKQPFLPPEFGDEPIALDQCQIDTKQLYHIFRIEKLISKGPKQLVHAKIDQKEIVKRLPWVKDIALDVIKELPNLLEKELQKLGREENKVIIQVLFSLYDQGVINNDLLGSLKKIYLFTQAKEKVNQCFRLFLPDCYSPKTRIQDYLKENPEFFVSEEYMQVGKEKKWKEFFTQMGVLEESTIFFEGYIKLLNLCQEGCVDSYVKELWRNNKQYLCRDKERGIQDNDIINGVTWFPYMEAIGLSRAYRDFFWRAFINKKEIIVKTKTFADFYYGSKGNQETFFHFVFRTQKLIQNIHGEFFFAHQLYAPALLEFIPDQAKEIRKKIAIFPEGLRLTEETEEFLGLRTYFTLEDCYFLLENQRKNDDQYDYYEYQLLMEDLLMNLENVQGNNAHEIKSKEWKFLSEEETWLSPRELKWWTPSSTPPTAQGKMGWIDKIFDRDRMAQFCKFFNISAETENSYELIAHSDTALRDIILGKLVDISFFWKNLSRRRSVKDCYELIVDKVKRLDFLVMEGDCNGKVIIKCKDDNKKFYYSENYNLKDVAKKLGKYLEFEPKEITKLNNVLHGKSIHTQRFKEFAIDFHNYPSQGYTEKTKRPSSIFDNLEVSDDELISSIEKLDLSETKPLPKDGPSGKEATANNFPTNPNQNTTTTSSTGGLSQFASTGTSTPSKTSEKDRRKELEELWGELKKNPPDQQTTPSSIQDASLDKTKSPTRTKTYKKEVNNQGVEIDPPMLPPLPKSPIKFPLTKEEEEMKTIKNKMIGNWAEKHVVSDLVRKYTEGGSNKNNTKYKGTYIQSEIKSGNKTFTYSDASKWKTIEVKWKNDPDILQGIQPKDELDKRCRQEYGIYESYGDCDIEIEKIGNGFLKDKKIEVKGTESRSIHFYLGTSEWASLVKSEPKLYQIHVVTDVGSSTSCITRYSNLFESIRTLTIGSSIEFRGPKVISNKPQDTSQAQIL